MVMLSVPTYRLYLQTHRHVIVHCKGEASPLWRVLEFLYHIDRQRVSPPCSACPTFVDNRCRHATCWQNLFRDHNLKPQQAGVEKYTMLLSILVFFNSFSKLTYSSWYKYLDGTLQAGSGLIRRCCAMIISNSALPVSITFLFFYCV